jgi:hypothetical protein
VNLLKRFSLSLCVALFCVIALSACSNQEVSQERPLTAEEASVLAEVLSRNHEAGGASFSLSARAGFQGGTITLEGDIDWVNHRGAARVFGGSLPHPVTNVWWSAEIVGERRPSLDQEVLTLLPGVRNPILARPPDSSRRRLDQLLAIVTGLVAKTPENSQLILQTEGSAFLREDVLREKPVLVLRYGKRSIFWLNASTKSLMRFEGNDSTSQFPVVIDFLQLGSRTLSLPRDAQVVNLSDHMELLAMVPSSP